MTLDFSSTHHIHASLHALFCSSVKGIEVQVQVSVLLESMRVTSSPRASVGHFQNLLIEISIVYVLFTLRYMYKKIYTPSRSEILYRSTLDR
jgi:hypothetical protein